MRVLPGLLCMTLACSALAQKDAAEKVQEGNVDNWIEYYKKQQEAKPPAGATAPSEGEREKVPPSGIPDSSIEGESDGTKPNAGTR